MYLIQEQTVGSISRVTGGFWSVSERKYPALVEVLHHSYQDAQAAGQTVESPSDEVSPSCNLRQTYETCKPLMSCAPRFASKLTRFETPPEGGLSHPQSQGEEYSRCGLRPFHEATPNTDSDFNLGPTRPNTHNTLRCYLFGSACIRD